MNRETRRNLGIKSKEPVMLVKRADLEKYKQQAMENATDLAMSLLFALPVKVLIDHYSDRMGDCLESFCEDLTDAYQDFEDGDLELIDLQKMLWDECGIRFENNKD